MDRFARINCARLRVAGLGLALAGLVIAAAWLAATQDALAAGECIEGMYKYCDGECPPEHTQQGECTTRLEQVGGTETRWCCCDNDYRPEDAGGETTIGGPPTSIGQCPSSDEEKPPESTWAATAAIRQTANPRFTDSVLYLVRDNILERNPKGKAHVEAVYRFAGPVDQILKENPKLAADTAALLTENLVVLLRLANDLRVTVSGRKIEQAVGLLERYSKAAGDNAELKQAIARAQRELKDRAFLQQLGIAVKD